MSEFEKTKPKWIKDLEDFILKFNYVNDPNSPIHREINMWREKYLKEDCKFEDITKSNQFREYFMVTPSAQLMNYSLSEYKKMIEKICDENPWTLRD
jgi:hypothetical protein